MKTQVLAVLLTILLLSPAVSEDAPMSVKPALNEPVSPVSAGTRPYEMEGRKEDRVPLVDFEDLTGWTAECENGAEGDVIRTREQQMWGEYVGKLQYTGTSADSKVILRPPAPIPIQGTFDCINMWIYGGAWEWAPEPGTPFVNVSILVTDSSGEENSIYLARVRWKEWWLAHKKLAAPMQSASFSGIEVSGLSNPEQRSIFMDSIYFYEEELEPLRFEPRPGRNLTLLPGQNQGLNGTGPGGLPFPTREQTILPTNFLKTYKNTTREISPGCYEFVYAAKDCQIRYVYKPSRGDLGEITAYVNGRKVCVPMGGGGLQIGNDAVSAGKLVASGLEDDAVVASFDLGGFTAEYRLRIWQKSLVMDFICRGGKATGLALGEVREVKNPKLVLIPYLTFGASNPRVLCFGPTDSPSFASVWVDWYRSNGSELWSGEWLQEKSARINGGVRYIPKTDGKRNDLYERVFLTISPTFEETLPTIANPPTPHDAVAGERLWQESWGPENYEREHQRSKMLRSYGIEKLIQCNHEITWRDGGESFTLRTKAAPKRGGDEALIEYVAAQKSLDWLSGLYTNYTDFAPVNEHWDEDYVQRTPEGEMRPAWPRCYALKPSRAVELDARLAPIIKRKFGSTSAYTDVQTAVAPWSYCDYDARVPGAGTFAATFYAYGELLLNDQKVYGPIFSEGTFQWLYAGLASGNYGLAYTGVDLSQEPLNVAFDLMKIHTLECDIGVPWTGGFFKDPSWKNPDKIDRSIDHFIAATMAYGHIGWLVEEEHGIQRTCRSYYMLQQLQKRYALRPPAEIKYADEKGRWFTASQAIARDVISHSRLYVRYDNGLQLYVNGSVQGWKITGCDGRPVELPPWGWYAFDRKTNFLELSALKDGQRIDYVHSGEYEYLDGRSRRTIHEGLAAKGSVAVRRKAGAIEIIDIFGNDEIGFRVPQRGVCTAYDADENKLGPVDLRCTQDGIAWFKVTPNARRYVFRPSKSLSQIGALSLAFPTLSVVPGDELVATIRFAANRSVSITSASLAIEGSAPVEIGKWKGLSAQSGKTYAASVPITFSKDIALGSSVWVKASVSAKDGRSVETWVILSAVPAFEIGAKRIGEGRYRIDVRNNLWCSPEPEVNVALKSGNTGIKIGKYERKDRTVILQPPSEAREASDIMVVQVRRKDRVVTREFTVTAVLDHPLVWNAGPDQPLAWGYCFRGGQEMHGSTATGACLQYTEIACAGVVKRGVFSHPPYIGGVGYTYGITGPIAIPDEDCEFRAFIGLKDGGDVSDGVLFSVSVLDGNGAEYPLIKEHWAKREWKGVSADLSAFRGRAIRLKFIADVGPDDNSNADWASWGEPRIVHKSAVMRIEVGH